MKYLPKKLLITGGADFIGSAVIRHIINNTNHSVINVDKLTYAGNLESLISIENDSSIAVDWQLEKGLEPLLSDKGQQGALLVDAEVFG